MRKICEKKGDPTDVLLFTVIIFFIAVSLVVALFVNTKVKSVIDNTVLNESAAYSSITTSFANINQFTVQRAFVMFFGLLIIGIMVSSFMIKVHPVFMFLYIITLSAAIFVTVYLANTYELIVSNGQLSTIADNYATMTWVMQHIIIILVAVGALSMIIIFGKIIGSGGVSTDI